MKRALPFLLLILAPVFAMPAAAAQSHDVQLSVNLASTCTTAKPCLTNVYRASASSPTAICPTTLSSYTAIASALVGTTITATGTTTVYDDQDPALQTGASYCYAATDLYVSGGGESGIGAITLVTFPAPPGPPQAITAVIKK